jgi:WD40 repeat protein/serine/threonine protein kinase
LCPHCLVLGGISTGQSQPRLDDSDSKATLHIVIPEDSALLTGAPKRLGKYELLEELARGGMGVVYKARHTGLGSIVAVKMIRSGVLATATDVERFQREARAAARLQHPNIVTIHDIGEQDGQHYFSMDYVAGANLAELARVKPFSPKQAAEITAGIAEAIQYAHEQGVLHRDIKPSNVILTPEQRPRVLDFGLARVVADDSQLTVSGTPLGSPCYMSPEQAAGHLRDVDPRSDVYSLGALLYELLTGRPPFQAATAVETLKLVLETEPIPPRRFNSTLPLDLETICLKCLEKEPKRRYSTAEDLRRELGRFIHDEPIHARPITRSEHVWRWCQRNPVVASLGAATAVLVLTVAVGSPIALFKINKARENETVQRQLAEHNLYVASINNVQQRWEEGNIMGAREKLVEIEHFPEAGFERDYWRRQVFPELITLRPHPHTVLGLAFSPDGKRIITAGSEDHTCQVWDVRTGTELLVLHGHTGRINCVAFSPDGTRIVTGGADRTVRLWDAITGKELRPPLSSHSAIVHSVAFSPNGKWIAAGLENHTAVIWDAVGGELHWRLAEHHDAVTSVAFLPDNLRLVTGSKDQTAKVWNIPQEKSLVTFIGHSDSVNALAVSVDGGRILTGGGQVFFDISWKQAWKPAKDMSGVSAVIWSTTNGVPLLNLTNGHSAPVMGAAFFPDSRRVVTASADGTAIVWDAIAGMKLFALEAHAEAINAVAVSSDGQLIATGSVDETVKIWRGDAPLSKQVVIHGGGNPVTCLAFSPDGQRLVTGTAYRTGMKFPNEAKHQPLEEDNTAKVWNSATGELLSPLKGHTAGILSVDYSPDGEHIVTGSADGTAIVWEASSGQRRFRLNTKQEEVTGVAFSPNNKWIVTWTSAAEHAEGFITPWRGAQLWDRVTCQELSSLPFADRQVFGLGFSPDSQQIITTGGPDATTWLWDLRSDQPQRRFTGGPHARGVPCCAFSTRGRLAVSGNDVNTATLWDVSTLTERRTFKGHSGSIARVAFSPDGKRVLTGSHDKTAKLWDVNSGQELVTFKGHTAPVYAVAFSPDGQRLATGSVDGTARVWEAGPPHKSVRVGGGKDPSRSPILGTN